jgi:hypothetical protein
MRRAQRVAAGVLLASALALLAGCSSNGADPSSSSATPSAILPAGSPAASGGPLAEGTLPADFKRYRNAQHGFSIGYPSTWQPQEDVGGTIVGFVAPSGASGGGDFVDNANITQEDIGATSLGEYNASARSQIQAAFPNAVFENEGGVTMGGEPAYAYQYTSQQGADTIRLLQVFAVREGTLTALTFAATVDRWPALSQDFQSMLGSFRFL